MKLERAVGKIVKLESFSLRSFKLERSILSWKEPFEVGKLEMKLERIALVGKHERKLERICLVGKLQMKLEKNA